MSEALIKAQIKVILEAVSGIGVVHNRERFSRSMAEFLTLMTSAGKINGWMIHRQSTGAKRIVIGLGNNGIERTHLFIISGLYEIDDLTDSESTFQALVEAIFTAFKDKPTLNGTAQSSEPLDVQEVDVDEHANRTFHTAQLNLTVVERI
jgi:hypothetical protein